MPKIYAVLRHPEKSATVVVRVGFNWVACIFWPLWFLFNRLWFMAAIALGITLGGLGLQKSFDTFAIEILSSAGYMLLWLVIGTLANRILMNDLESRGYAKLKTVRASNRDEARELAELAESKDVPSAWHSGTMPLILFAFSFAASRVWYKGKVSEQLNSAVEVVIQNAPRWINDKIRIDGAARQGDSTLIANVTLIGTGKKEFEERRAQLLKGLCNQNVLEPLIRLGGTLVYHVRNNFGDELGEIRLSRSGCI